MAFPHDEISLHRQHLSRILRRSEGRISFFRAIRLFKHHLSDFIQVSFFHVQDAENELLWRFDTMKQRIIDFTKVVS
jgi:hypothetical protein